MLKCPVCGCTNFPNQDLSVDSFRCPVIGCDGVIETKLRPNAVRSWKKPANAMLDWAQKKNTDSSNESPRR